MAIQKTKTLASGIEGNYWRMSSVYVDTMTMQATYSLSLHKDYANRWSPPILYRTKVYTFTLSPLQMETANLRALGYQLIMERAESIVPVLFGNEGETTVFDPDLAGGEEV